MAKNAQPFEERPWGTFEIVHEFIVANAHGNTEDVIVKTLVILPTKKLSYQQHELRAETWSVVQGTGIAIINDTEIPLAAGAIIHVPKKTKHRLINTHPSTNLIVVEVGQGTFDEFDIKRFEDDFGRTG